MFPFVTAKPSLRLRFKLAQVALEKNLSIDLLKPADLLWIVQKPLPALVSRFANRIKPSELT